MRRRRRSRVGRLCLTALVAACVLAAALALAWGLPSSGSGPDAAAAPGVQEPTPQTDASVPATTVTMIGAAPEEPEAPAGGETWGVGVDGEKTTVLVRYYDHPAAAGGEEGTWTLGPALPKEFKLAASPLAGQMTPKGFGVLAGTAPVGTNGKVGQVVLVRRPGGGVEETAHVPIEGEEPKPAEPLLAKGQSLFGQARAPMIAPLEEADGQAGALVVPVSEASSVESDVLHWDGQRWSGEPIEIPAKSAEGFRVLAIGASSADNAWLLARLSSNYPSGAVALFRRVEEKPEHWSWKPVALQAGAGDGEAHPLTVPVLEPGAPPAGEPFAVPGASSVPVIAVQLLTVTSQGVWIDGARGDVEAHTPASTTLFFEPEGPGGGHVVASWCEFPAGTPAGAPRCEHELPQALPTGPSRSIAWAGAAPFGERVITGLPTGVSLRLEGESFKRVLALGGGEQAAQDPGAAFGAAFSSPTEGWLGESAMPVHLTLKPQPSRLTPWPVSFRKPLLAIAPEPGAPTGALSSEALAVGEGGAVARFKPGEGWLPESLYGPGEKVENEVRLRAVAWPAPSRAYAVGDGGEMWLWRGETGLWERDPATPINFRANLVGVAFDPSNPARGYAVGTSVVGQGGVLLRYGKTWTEETGLPAQVQGAGFSSIAFAGSEAIVAYSRQPDPSRNAFVGGLLVNEGSGWRVDQEAESLAGGAVPLAVAGLPDGGAAFVVSSGEGKRLYERESAGSPWRAAPTPLPSSLVGSLALFREGGALRAIVTAGGTGLLASSGSSTPGSPPFLVPPSGVPTGSESGGVLRQTAVGWSDDGHELNPVGAPEGSYIYHDLPYRPDPIFAVLIGPTGTQGWAVGGSINSQDGRLETANVERYPSDGVTPLGSSVSPVPSTGAAMFAFGGGAQCAAPCSDQGLARVGPPAWLTSALALTGGVGEGGGARVGAFFDLGPTVTEGAYEGATPPTIPYARELGDYASIFAGARLPVDDAIAPSDLDARPEQEGTEASWETAFAGFPRPFGGEGAASPEEPKPCGALAGCESAYYAVEQEGVWVLVLDDSVRGEVDQAQREWLEQRLGRAGGEGKPVIVAGNSDLAAQIAAHDEEAIRLFQALVGDNPDSSPAGDPDRYVASAYFYDAPEENVQAPLIYGGQQLPTFGTGTLGYEKVVHEQAGSFHGAKGILLGEAHLTERKPDDEAPVSVRLIPVVGELALEAKQGTLLRRSSPVLFEGLARRPRAGCRAQAGETLCAEDQYTPIPSVCVGTGCQTALLPEYEFTSSNKEVGRFVERNTGSKEALTVLQNAKGESIVDEPEAGKPRSGPPQSGLFCAYNAGTTIVTIRAGGLSSSLPVTVQPGSVREPCGTVPLKHQTVPTQSATPVPPPAPAPAPAGPAPSSSSPPLVPVPPPPLAVIPPAPARPTPRTPPPPFFIQPALPFVTPAFVPAPPPAPAEPTPPSGTSAVTSPVEAAEKEEETEEAPDTVSNQAVAYRAPEHEPSSVYVLGIVLLAAFAGASVGRRRPRRGRREIQVAPATLSTMRAQRRIEERRRRSW